ncbi:hypothetical protein ACCT09_21470, partial [Rhizobium ruizarguesonis]
MAERSISKSKFLFVPLVVAENPANDILPTGIWPHSGGNLLSGASPRDMLEAANHAATMRKQNEP